MPIIMIFIIIPTIILLLSLAIKKIKLVDKIYHKSFWWDTMNGLNYSRATLYKVKFLPLYYITHDCNYKSPYQHIDYNKFLDKVKEIKKNPNNIKGI